MSTGERDALARTGIPSWSSLRRPLVLVLVVVVGLVTVWATVANYVVVSRDPETPVDTYLSYLEGGSSRQVLAPLLVAGGQDVAQLLPNQVYRSAANRPVGHEFVGTVVQGGRAVVNVGIHLGDGTTVRRAYTVEQVSAWGPFNDVWQLDVPDATTVQVRTPAALDALSVNGETVRPDAAHVESPDPARPQARAWRFEALPGVYDVALPKNSYLQAVKHVSAGISMTAPRPAVTAELALEASPRLWEGAERAVQQRLDECGKVLQFDVARCPAPAQLTGATSSGGHATATPDPGRVPPGVSNVRWELKSRPSLLLEQDAEDPLTFHAVRFRAAEATVTWLQNGQQHSGSVRFGIEVTARTTGEELSTDVALRSALTEREKKAASS